ncbi:MAG: tRNA (N(6)-L-threonylcarbamoyladenosine(37)-C(2))-methylthiotransferase MtaB [bacterium]
MKIAFLTYGCKLNRYETEAIKQLLTGGSAEDPEEPDWYLINTCTVTAKIDAEIRSKIRKLKAAPGKKVIVTGCTAQRKDKKELLAGADFIITNEDKFKLEKYPKEVQALAPRQANGVLRGFSASNKAFIKVEDGCDRFCAYCEIPYVRGAVIKSRGLLEIKNEVENMVTAGFSEIILSGVNLGLFGYDRKEKNGLAGLLEELLKINKNFRIRLSSIGPKEMTNELIVLAKKYPEKICPHFHMSLQAGEDSILKLMKRNYTTSQFEERVEYILSHLPGAALTTDVIAGFPGETQKEFETGAEFISKMPFSRLHIFPYSDRPDAAASDFKGKVSKAEKKNRVGVLLKIGAAKEKLFARAALGGIRTVLVETSKRNGKLCGYTQDYIMTGFEGGNELINKLVKVKLKTITENEVFSEIIN